MKIWKIYSEKKARGLKETKEAVKPEARGLLRRATERCERTTHSYLCKQISILTVSFEIV